MKLQMLQRGFVVILPFFLSACLGSSGGMVSDEVTADQVVAGVKPYIEALIEYPGPHPDWAGPSSWSVHVTTSDSGKVQLLMTPPFFELNPKNVPTAEAARETLARLYVALQADVPAVKGCLSLIRVKLVRGDGVVSEKQACRGQAGWPHFASETVHHFLGYGNQEASRTEKD